MTLTRYIPIPVLYLVWPKVGDNHWWETPTPLIEPKCGVSNNAKADVRWWPKTADVEDEDGHHNQSPNVDTTTTSKTPQFAAIMSLLEQEETRRSGEKKHHLRSHCHSTYKLHNEKPLGFPKKFRKIPQFREVEANINLMVQLKERLETPSYYLLKLWSILISNGVEHYIPPSWHIILTQ